jgi:hypothetical protein
LHLVDYHLLWLHNDVEPNVFSSNGEYAISTANSAQEEVAYEDANGSGAGPT